MTETISEPRYQEIDKTDKSIPLKIFAVADYAKYEIDTKEVFFRPTLMFTSRSYKIKLKNISSISMKYSLKITSAETG